MTKRTSVGKRTKYNRSFTFSKPLHLIARAMPNQQKRRRLKKLNGSIRKLKWDMVEISEEQKEIKEGQRQVREKFEAIESQYDQLRQETNQIMHHTLNTQLRLALMFQILKARENHDYHNAAKLTSALRELVAQDNRQRSVFQNEG
ncbi:putative Phosphatidylinositol glycan [Hibiscus syriacus]|uniref:Phosphatidylinositol glycan n=1 Tax=Hibiscus syriacus TaxID=106335 RepID=A0A6A2W8F6_HIBSY|nr:uncharacterized protein LOC120197865 isoform X2 [Hibiscus syriacus]KAE8653812.1 putative Phosphatidylinositol glycan [Hibiscus syriacus]